jgi:hypothetical protein
MMYASFMGNFGNCLFQYTFSRLLQEQLGYSLSFPRKEIAKLTCHFPGIATSIDGSIVDDGPELVVDEASVHDDPQISIEAVANECRPHQRRICICGYFERSYWYAPARERIRTWIPFDRAKPSNCPVINIRGGDRRDMTLEEADYYRAAIQRIGPDAIIVTEDPSWDFVNSLGLPVVHRSPLEDFQLCATASELVIGRSTFSWWAAFLGNARRVIQPEPKTTWRSRDQYFFGYLGMPDWEKIEIA